MASAHFEVYAAEGAFVEDADTDQWHLIGGPGGLEIVAGPLGKITVGALTKSADRVSIEFTSQGGATADELQESADLKSWQAVPGAAFEKTANGLRVSAGGATGVAKFYRVVLR